MSHGLQPSHGLGGGARVAEPLQLARRAPDGVDPSPAPRLKQRTLLVTLVRRGDESRDDVRRRAIVLEVRVHVGLLALDLSAALDLDPRRRRLLPKRQRRRLLRRRVPHRLMRDLLPLEQELLNLLLLQLLLMRVLRLEELPLLKLLRLLLLRRRGDAAVVRRRGLINITEPTRHHG